jgi:hypothetical protein
MAITKDYGDRWERNRERARERSRTISKFKIDLKLKAGKCVDCEMKVTENNWMCFDWDHIEPGSKTQQVSQLSNIDRIVAEIAKCELRCRNCHAIRTHRERERFVRHEIILR